VSASDARTGSEAVWTPLELVRWTTDYFKSHGVGVEGGKLELFLRIEACESQQLLD